MSAEIDVKLDLHDVSVLYPLPDMNSWDDLLAPSRATNLLPYDVFDKIPFLINRPNDLTYPTMRVVGVRIDPCFMERLGPLRCEHQIRFIWQPLEKTDTGTTTVDASVHVFFRLENSEFFELLKKLKTLKSDYQKAAPEFRKNPLGVHPLLQKFGLKSTYANKLNKLFLNAIENKNLRRITFMKLKGVNDIWIFGGFETNNDQLVEMKIPRLDGATQQDFINRMAMRPNPTKFRGGIFPSFEPEDLFNVIAKDSFNLDGTSEEELRKTIRMIADIEHPQRSNPATVDCATCHLANTMRAWVNINFAQMNLDAEYAKVSYKNENFNLSNQSLNQGQTNILRLFGYFGENPFISLRTINESAEVIRFIESMDQ